MTPNEVQPSGHALDRRLPLLIDQVGPAGAGCGIAVGPAPDSTCVTVMQWAREYLCNPHPDLGRRGPVCPYVPASLAWGRFHVVPYPAADMPRAAVAMAVEHCRQLLLARSAERRRGSTKGDAAVHTTVLLTFPALDPVPAQVLVEEVQHRAKTAFVEQGLMIGEFHPGPPPAPGLHNPHFRPLASPVPLLALRHMVAADQPFLRSDPTHLAAYRRRFGSGARTAPSAAPREQA
ncbi:DUF6875 domain-containing protein [Streptomyces sp. NPDC050803]|uniref:DUF6875 domain-containing protein n=1 Tax=unclassified Streptomyces TaxID=2593676 RepID=UPI00343C63B0